MKTPTRHRHVKVFALLALGLSGLLYAVAVFIPTTQPTVELGKYALRDRDLLAGDTKAYRPWFENGAWQGDVIEYNISALGIRTTTAPVGLYCIDDASCDQLLTYGTTSLADTSELDTAHNWMARASYHAKESGVTDYWKARKIITNVPGTGQVDFLWTNLNGSQQLALDSATVDAGVADPTIAADPYASDILNYIRGERLHERGTDTKRFRDSKANLRTRYSLLGDVTSSPLYIGPPRELLINITGFSAFDSVNDNRPGRVAVGANDGILRILNATNGVEELAYIPSMVIPKLDQLAARDTTYDHTYYVAGEMAASSANINGTWKTVLAGGGGPGFAGLYALDMTVPPVSTDSTTTANKLLFEQTGGNWGHVYGTPRIGAVGSSTTDPGWFVFAGNGYSMSGSHPTALMVVSLDNPYTGVHSITTGTLGGLSAPVLVSTDEDIGIELVFAGDIKGDLWMFEIDDSDIEASTATKVFDGSIDQPIANTPGIALHPDQSGLIIYFGTGSIFSTDDALNDGLDNNGNLVQTQAIYGIWVDTSNMSTLKAGLPYTASDLQAQTLDETKKTFSGVEETLRVVKTENPVNYSCSPDDNSCTEHKGFKITLPKCGERMNGVPFVRAGRIQFVTTNPSGLNCGEPILEGDSWVMSLDYVTGGDGGNTIVYNLNGDDALDVDDTVSVTINGTATDKAPVGLNLGPGNIAQPAFVRLKAGVDKMYINGIVLPLPVLPNTGPILGGHIDVMTDSPSDGVIATNMISKHSEGLSISTGTNDGLGGNVDGHVHGYDDMHDVDYVDFFELEPRRGEANLIASVRDPSTNTEANGEDGSCSTTTGSKEISFNGVCLQAIEGELNRAYDTLHTDGDGVSHTSVGTELQSEVNSLGANPNFDIPVPDTKFIVVLANAERSTGGTLQIGCRTWNVVDYQNMITDQLLADPDSSKLVDKFHDNDTLIFTLADIIVDNTNYSCPDEQTAIAKGLSELPTMRVGFGQRSILDEGIHATRSQCVAGHHDPSDKVCFTDQAVLSTAEEAVAAHDEDSPDFSYDSCTEWKEPDSGPPVDYIRDPARGLHVTEAFSNEGKGFRWRNGALVVQLLNVEADGSAGYQLQPVATTDEGLGLLPDSGIVARAFQVSCIYDPEGICTSKVVTPDKAAEESGMLYEASIFWHYATLVDDIRNLDPEDNRTPSDAPCYGDPNYSGKNTIDVGGLNPSDYKKLTQPLKEECEAFEPTEENPVCDLDRYGQLLEIIDNAETDDELNQALLELAELLENNDALAKYVKFRDYVGDKIKDSDRLNIDKGNTGDSDSGNISSNDGIPVDVETIETIDLEARGPNYVYGRRNWIDIRR